MVCIHSEGDGWSEPDTVAVMKGVILDNDLCTDKYGTVHWLYGYWHLYWCMYKDGKWTEPETLTDKIIETGFITATPDGRVYAVYYSYGGVIYYRVYEDGAWGEEKIVREYEIEKGERRWPVALTWDVKSKVHMLLRNLKTKQLDYTVYDTLHGWSAYEQISDIVPDTTHGYVKIADICTDRDGNPHIVFSPQGEFDYYFSYRYYDGEKWSKIIYLGEKKGEFAGYLNIMRDFKRKINHIIYDTDITPDENKHIYIIVKHLQVDEHLNERYDTIFTYVYEDHVNHNYEANKYYDAVLSPDGSIDAVFTSQKYVDYHGSEDCFWVTTRSVGIEEEESVDRGISIGIFKDSIVLELNREEYVKAELFDNKGSKLEVLYTGSMLKGRHIIGFDRSTLPKGIYFLRITHNKESETKKIIVVE